MKTLSFIVPTCLVFILAACGGQASEQTQAVKVDNSVDVAQTPYDGPNSSLIAEFDASEEILMAAIEGVHGAQWTFRESEDRWSIGEIVEHVIIAEEGLVHGFVAGTIAGEPNAETSGDYATMDDGVRAFARDRSTSLLTNEAGEPRGIYATPEEALAAFRETRAKTIGFLKTTNVDWRAFVSSPNPELDPMDIHRWLIFIAGHVERHADQIAQVKAHAHYPEM